jgi:hypothetical protein
MKRISLARRPLRKAGRVPILFLTGKGFSVISIFMAGEALKEKK